MGEYIVGLVHSETVSMRMELYIVISMEMEKALDKVQHIFLMSPNSLGAEGKFLNMIKAIDEKSTPSIIISRGNRKLFR
jgi:hypothetical protein